MSKEAAPNGSRNRLSRRSQSVKRAKAVITNPIHIAVAVEYDQETEPAPRKIVTMGKGRHRR